jgi:hypothetical protein
VAEEVVHTLVQLVLAPQAEVTVVLLAQMEVLQQLTRVQAVEVEAVAMLLVVATVAQEL